MAENDTKAAFAGVIADAAAADAAANAQEQLTLLPTRFEPGSDQHDRVVEAIKRDRRGRPAGAQNIATREMKAFVIKVFGDPLLWRFRYLTHTPETLALELGCSKLEAYDRLDRLAADLSKLFYGSMAPVDGAGNAAVPRLTVMFGGQSGGDLVAMQAGRKPWDYLDVANEQTQQNQALLTSENAPSHDAPSHGSE